MQPKAVAAQGVAEAEAAMQGGAGQEEGGVPLLK